MSTQSYNPRLDAFPHGESILIIKDDSKGDYEVIEIKILPTGGMLFVGYPSTVPYNEIERKYTFKLNQISESMLQIAIESIPKNQSNR